MPELVGFQTMVILYLKGMTFDAGGVFGPEFWLLFKSGSSYCDNGTKAFLNFHLNSFTRFFLHFYWCMNQEIVAEKNQMQLRDHPHITSVKGLGG
jgi:hypothetical protein